MTPADLSTAVDAAIASAVRNGQLAVDVPTQAVLERPRSRAHGDYATSIALRLAKSTGRPAGAIADLIATSLRGASGVADVTVRANGFLEITLDPAALAELPWRILTAGSAYGRSTALAGRWVELERGTPTVFDGLDAHRAALVGDALAQLLRAAGCEVDVRDVGTSDGRSAGVGPGRVRLRRATDDGAVTEELNAGPVRLGGGADVAPSAPWSALEAAVGADTARYALLRAPVAEPVELDPARWSRRDTDNPAFAVRFAGARAAEVARHAQALGVGRGPSYDAALLTGAAELALLDRLGEFPGVVAAAARRCEPHRVARHLEALADEFLTFTERCPVLPRGDARATSLTRARLWLCEAARVVLATGLGRLGIRAPERM